MSSLKAMDDLGFLWLNMELWTGKRVTSFLLKYYKNRARAWRSKIMKIEEGERSVLARLQEI